nr:MAG TPA: hypothetical protein [Caudoviricetes sp.]
MCVVSFTVYSIRSLSAFVKAFCEILCSVSTFFAPVRPRCRAGAFFIFGVRLTFVGTHLLRL